MQRQLQEHNRVLVDEDNATKHLNDTLITLDIDEDGTYPRVYTWRNGEWGTCAGVCGNGNATQTREVVCEDSIGTQDETKCDADTKPATSQECTASVCPTTPTPTPTPNQAPVFTSDANASVEENVQPKISAAPAASARRGISRIALPHVVMTLTATDTDTPITYSISGGDSGNFDVNTTSGEVVFLDHFPDFETKRTYLFTATATDSKSASTTQDVNISITDLVDVTHNSVSYGSVVSSETGELWLDRNLGASQACTALNDTDCYGDYYQWGRNADGHEKSGSVTNTTLATDINTTGLAQEGQFIRNSSNPYDWVENTTQNTHNVDDNGSLRTAEWSKTDGTSVCPSGFRVPTEAELVAENISNGDDAFTKLKLPSAGYRLNDSGSLGLQGSFGFLWSSSVSGSYSRSLGFYSGNALTGYYERAYGFSVRCLRD